MPSPIEIEYKFPVSNLATTRQKLDRLGATPVQLSQQTDEYLNDPLRDFAKMDLALRVRQTDDRYFITFKGPNLDPTAKIRTEIETPLANAEVAEQIKQTFLGIGFYSVAAVTKTRETMKLTWNNQPIEVCLDSVSEIGDFIELEIVVDDQDKTETAKSALESLAAELALSGSIRTSYLELLLRQRGDIE